MKAAPHRAQAAFLRTEAEKYRAENPRPRAPCYDQTREQIEEYYRNAPLGEPAAVRQTQGGFLAYHIETIQGRRPRVGKVDISRFGDFYMRSGKECWAPTGQTRLVVPTEEVLSWAKEHPPRSLTVGLYEYEINWL